MGNFVKINPELLLFSRNLMIYHYSAFQIIIFLNIELRLENLEAKDTTKNIHI